MSFLANAAIVTGVILLFISIVSYLLYLDAKDIERRRARGETIEPPSMWP